MKMDRIPAGPRRATNVSLSEPLLAEAKALGLNVSRACETGLEVEVRREREERWMAENRAAIQEWNEWVRENGLPLGDLHQF